MYLYRYTDPQTNGEKLIVFFTGDETLPPETELTPFLVVRHGSKGKLRFDDASLSDEIGHRHAVSTYKTFKWLPWKTIDRDISSRLRYGGSPMLGSLERVQVSDEFLASIRNRYPTNSDHRLVKILIFVIAVVGILALTITLLRM